MNPNKTKNAKKKSIVKLLPNKSLVTPAFEAGSMSK